MQNAQFDICDKELNGLQSAINLTKDRNNPLLHAAVRRHFKADSALTATLLADHPVAIIYCGAIGLQHILSDGRRSISTIFLSGEILDFRYMKVSNGILISLTASELCLFRAADFDRLLAQQPHIQAAVTASHFRNFSFAASHCVDLARKSAVEKLASFIFECRSRQSECKTKGIRLLLKRIDIADYMGLRPETLSRAFAKLKQRKIIASDGISHIQILDEPALRQIANGAALDYGCVA